jgi:hypothetical protein
VIDPTGTLVLYLRDGLGQLPAEHPWRSAWVHGGGIPAKKKPRGIFVQRLSSIRERFQLGHYRFTIRVYGVLSQNVLESERDAALGSSLVSDLMHMSGPYKTTSGVLIYKAREEVGGQPGRDPDTGWDYETSIYLVHAATQAVA